jgi:hypothetical protein
MSVNPAMHLTFDEIDSEAVSAFVSSMKSSELWVKQNTPQTFHFNVETKKDK